MTPKELGSVDIRPEVNILAVLKHLNYKPWYALAEFVDNSLASVLAARKSDPNTPKLVVRITVDIREEGSIVIEDNAYGIALDDFPRAFRAAEVPPDRSGLSEFGMGMKSAASWFAKRWNVRTSVKGEPVQRSVAFDLDSIMAHQSHSIPVVATPALSGAHFTILTLEGLNHRPQGRTLSKIKDHLRSIYREFLRSGLLELRFNDEVVKFEEVEVLYSPPAWANDSKPVSWLKNDIDIDLGEGRRVRGFAGLRAVGSTSEAGFALLRRNRLIVGSHDETYRPERIFGRSNTYVYQRLFGELELSGFSVSHTKDGFQWDDHEEEFLEALRKSLRNGDLDLLKQAAEYRVNLPSPDETRPIRQATAAIAENLKIALPDVISELEREKLDATAIPDSAVTLPNEIRAASTVQLQTEKGSWEINLMSIVDPTLSRWLDVASFTGVKSFIEGKEKTVLDVGVNFAHPFSRRFVGAAGENSALLLSFAAATSVALALGKKGGAKSAYILRFLNQVLRGTIHVSSPNEGEDRDGRN